MKIVANTSLPAVDCPNADRWNAARSRQFDVDGSWEQIANDTLLLVEQEQSCLKSVVTFPETPDQPEVELLEHKMVSDIFLYTLALMTRLRILPHSAPSWILS